MGIPFEAYGDADGGTGCVARSCTTRKSESRSGMPDATGCRVGNIGSRHQAARGNPTGPKAARGKPRGLPKIPVCTRPANTCLQPSCGPGTHAGPAHTRAHTKPWHKEFQARQGVIVSITKQQPTPLAGELSRSECSLLEALRHCGDVEPRRFNAVASVGAVAALCLGSSDHLLLPGIRTLVIQRMGSVVPEESAVE